MMYLQMRKADLKCLITDLIVESTQLKLRNKNKSKIIKIFKY